MTGGALRTALLAKVKNVGINELTSGTGSAASVCSDVFVMRSSGGGRYGCVWINGGGGDVLTRLAFIKAETYTSETSWSTLGTSIAYSLLIKVDETILDTFIGL